MSTSPEQDPYLFDAEQLHAIADESLVARGLDHFRKGCVADLYCGTDGLSASVEDLDDEEPYVVMLSYDSDGNLVADCPCGAEGPVCRHGVAVLFAYGARASEGATLADAVGLALEERAQRGRTEVQVEKIGAGDVFGLWHTQSVKSASHFPRSYQVHIRSLRKRANYCTCPDFAHNQLGTCKHIEAVLHKLGKRPDFARLSAQSTPYPYAHLSWEVEEAPAILLHRSDPLPPGLDTLLDEYFDETGRFRGRLPEEFFRFADRVRDRDDFDLGEDVVAHVNHLAESAARRLRARELGEQIGTAGGRLPGIRVRLYPYQAEGVAFLTANGRALLADDMGLGKTLQAISAAVWLQRNAGAERILVICPASLKHQWAREIERFSGQPVNVVQGGPEARAAQYRRGAGFTIINYELVLRDLSLINENLRPDLLILDEAQRIKNWRTKIASAVKLIPSRYAFVLSGTPLENRLEDLYSLMQVVDPKALGPLWRYLVDFHVTDDRGKVLGYRNLSELRRRLAPVMLRRDRRLVSDQLPQRIQQRLDLPLTEKQRELHDAALSAAASIGAISKRRPLTPGEQNRLMATLQQARMAANAAGLIDDSIQGAPKLDELENLLDELCLQGGRKAVVFSQWTRMTEMAEERLSAMGLGCVRLHGGVPTAKRGDLTDRFREDDGVQVFISTDAGGVGLNLQNASVLVNLDIPWNPAVLEQRIARIHRLGQKETVQIILMVSSDSYEERVYGLVRNKQALFDNVVNPDGGEDVVGVSRKLLEVLLEDLEEEKPRYSVRNEVPPADEDATTADEDGGAEAGKAPAPEPDRALEQSLAQLIGEIQRSFGPRLKRIMGSGGGLLAVLDRVDEEAEAAAISLSQQSDPPITVALVDLLSLRSLERLGAASPVQAGPSFYEADTAAPSPAERLNALARERLAAAELLIEQQCQTPGLELLVSSLLAGAASRAGLLKPPATEEAPAWLFIEAVPSGRLNHEQAGLIMRAIAHAQAGEVPEREWPRLLDEARSFILSDCASP
ncbi:MAG: SWIM zinc finger family protein [Gammaproteobacteria bacterium]|nr:SWIM zinc finger family protein [Gammaproteobacteria bacterium]MBU1656112.1 SWIM zinc finger family protein [Gammaproteobacteria bacterium]MBU1962197.1 SWIM zinc finger family protein [Gammaproteobacteria bacterium]